MGSSSAILLLALGLLPVGVWSQTAIVTSKASEIRPNSLSTDCTFRGKVKSIIVRQSNHDTAVCTFRADGQPVASTFYHEENASQRFVNLYDAHGAVRETDIYDSEDPQHRNRGVIHRDSAGRISETDDFDPDGTLNERTVKQYDARGNVVEERSYNERGRLTGRLKRTFNGANQVTSEESRDATGKLAHQNHYVYDSNGHTIEQFFQYGKDAGRYVFRYDAEGWLQSAETILDSERVSEMPNLYGLCGDCGLFPGKTVYRYTPEGFVQEEQMIQLPGNVVRLSRYQYDAQGGRTREWVYEESGSKAEGPPFTVQLNGRSISFTWTNGLAEATYTYDAHGNWMKAVVTRLVQNTRPSPREVSEVLSRQIVYR